MGGGEKHTFALPLFILAGGAALLAPPTFYASAYSIPRFTTIVYHMGGPDDFLPSPPLLLLFSSVILSISLFPDSMVLRLNIAEIFVVVCYIYTF